MGVIGTDQKLQLGQLLVKSGALTEPQLAEALALQRREGNRLLLGELLVEKGICTEEQIMEALARGYGVPFARVSARIADPKAVELLPREFLQRHTVLPLFRVRNVLTIAVAEPANVFLIEEVARMAGCQVQIVCAPPKDIRSTLETYLPQANVFVIEDILEDAASPELSLVDPPGEDVLDVEALTENSPVVRVVNHLISGAVRESASDIHIEPEESHVRIRYRIDGRLQEKMKLPRKIHPALVSRIKIMSALDISERRLPQDGGIHVLMQGQPVDLRVSVLNGRNGEKVVIRIIDNRSVLVSLDKLGFGHETLGAWRKVISAPNGIVLVTGPTGSGKSTTLYSCLRELNGEEVNICTIEDPVEFNLPGVNQFQVNERIGFSFAAALRSLLRQDPDIVMVGEIRDAETARIAVQAALTGHLVFSTLHTNDAPGAVTRLLNIGVQPYLVAASVVGVLAQRLVRRICPHCKEPHQPPPAVGRAIERLVGQVETFYRGAGCGRCRQSGYTGRVGIYELLVPDDALRDRITAHPSVHELRKLAADGGMAGLRSDGMSKARAGITTVEEVLRVTAA